MLTIDKQKLKYMKKLAEAEDLTLSQFITRSLCNVDSRMVGGTTEYKKK